MDEQQGLEIVGKILENKTPLVFRTTLADAWLALTAIQLTITHPHLHEPIKTHLTRIGRELQDIIVIFVPGAEELAEMGWNRDYDYIFDDDDDDDDDFPF